MVLWDFLMIFWGLQKMFFWRCPHDFLGFLGISLGVLEPSHVLGRFSCGFLRFSHVSLGPSHGFWGLLMVLGGIPVFFGVLMDLWGRH